LGCPLLVRSGRCRGHALAHAAGRAAAKRASATRWVYLDPRWTWARKRALERAGGRCEALEAGARCTATRALHGHHAYPGGLEQMLADGADPFALRWIVVLCGRHHGQLEAWLRAHARPNRLIRR
jgi:hypothetical protein